MRTWPATAGLLALERLVQAWAHEVEHMENELAILKARARGEFGPPQDARMPATFFTLDLRQWMTGREWAANLEDTIVDPDGWRLGDNVDFDHTPITREEYERRIVMCTIMLRRGQAARQNPQI